MGKTLDALLHRSTLKSSKFNPLVNLALHRIAVLKNQRQVRCNIAKSDVVEILKMGLHDRALLRVEHVIKEQNMLDVFVMLESYCNMVIERFHLISQEKSCPEELKEAIAGLLYAASRCGEFPELQEIRAVFTSHYGKEFTARAVELRNNCGVSPALIQKLSTRMPSLENRMSVLRQIADEKGITLQLGESSSSSSFGKHAEAVQTSAPVAIPTVEDDDTEREMYFGSVKAKKYVNAADAAQAAFESAAYAAHAARAAVELSRGDSNDSEGSNSPHPRRRKLSDHSENSKLGTHVMINQVSIVQENDTLEIAEASDSLKKSGSKSFKTNAETSDAVDTHNSKHENRTIDIKYHVNKMEHNTSSDIVSIDVLDVSTTDDEAKAASFEEHGNEESWIRREWNSKLERMKRPFSHSSRGPVTAR